MTSETQQWLTRNWERHDHWPLILELYYGTVKADPNERLERTQRRGKGHHFGSFLTLNHLTVFTWSKRDKEFSHEESHKMSRVVVLKSNSPSAFDSSSVDQTFSSSPAISYPADFWVSVFKNRVLKDVFVLIFVWQPTNTGTARASLTRKLVADLVQQIVNHLQYCLKRWRHLYITLLTSICFFQPQLTDFQHKVSKALWASSLSSCFQLHKGVCIPMSTPLRPASFKNFFYSTCFFFCFIRIWILGGN